MTPTQIQNLANKGTKRVVLRIDQNYELSGKLRNADNGELTIANTNYFFRKEEVTDTWTRKIKTEGKIYKELVLTTMKHDNRHYQDDERTEKIETI